MQEVQLMPESPLKIMSMTTCSDRTMVEDYPIKKGFEVEHDFKKIFIEPMEECELEVGCLTKMVPRKKITASRKQRMNMKDLLIWGDFDFVDFNQMMESETSWDTDQPTDATNPLWRLAVCAAIAYEQEHSEEEEKMQINQVDQSSNDLSNKRCRSRKSEIGDSQFSEDISDKTAEKTTKRGNKKRKASLDPSSTDQKQQKQQTVSRRKKNSGKSGSNSPSSTQSPGLLAGDYANFLSHYQNMLQQNNIDLSALVSSQQLLERNPLADLNAHQIMEWSKLMQCMNQQQQQQQQFIQQQQQQQQLQQQQQQKLPQVQIPQQISLPMKTNNKCRNNDADNSNNSNCSRMKTFVCANQKLLQFPRELKHSIIHVYIAKKIQCDMIQGKKLKNNNNNNKNNTVNNDGNKKQLQPNTFTKVNPSITQCNISQKYPQNFLDNNKLSPPSLTNFSSRATSCRTLDFTNSGMSETFPAQNVFQNAQNVQNVQNLQNAQNIQNVQNLLQQNSLPQILSQGIANALSQSPTPLNNFSAPPQGTLNMLKALCSTPQYQNIMQNAIQYQQFQQQPGVGMQLLNGILGQQLLQQQKQQLQQQQIQNLQNQLYNELGRLLGGYGGGEAVQQLLASQLQSYLGQNGKGGFTEQDLQSMAMMNSMQNNQGMVPSLLGAHFGLQAGQVQK